MRAAGIDLGAPGKCGLCILESNGAGRPKVLLLEALKLEGYELQQRLIAILREYVVGVAATERPFTGRFDPKPKVGLSQRERQAAVKMACQAVGVKFVDFMPQTIKAEFAGSRKATKADMIFWAGKRLGVAERAGEHLADAAAICHTALEHRNDPPKPKAKRQDNKRGRVRSDKTSGIRDSSNPAVKLPMEAGGK